MQLLHDIKSCYVLSYWINRHKTGGPGGYVGFRPAELNAYWCFLETAGLMVPRWGRCWFPVSIYSWCSGVTLGSPYATQPFGAPNTYAPSIGPLSGTKHISIYVIGQFYPLLSLFFFFGGGVTSEPHHRGISRLWIDFFSGDKFVRMKTGRAAHCLKREQKEKLFHVFPTNNGRF